MKKDLGLVQRQIEIAWSRGITMKEIVVFDLDEDSFLFEYERAFKPDKRQFTKCLEVFIEIQDFLF